MGEKFPGKKVARINTCFAKLLKKRRIALYRQDPEENKNFLLYHEGAWRIAYFEDDRELMEEVLEDPAMKETIKRQLGVPIATLDSYFRPSTTESSSSDSRAGLRVSP